MDREQFINELAKINVFLNDNQLSQLEEYYELLLDESRSYSKNKKFDSNDSR